MTVFFGILSARIAVSPLVPDITAEFGVSTGVIGLALTGLWAAYGLFQLPGGVLVSRYGERPIILVGVGLSALGAGLLAFAPSFFLFAAAAFLLGGAGGFYFPAATALLTRRFENTGQALGFHIGGGDLSGLITPVIVAFVAVRFGFRPALLLAGVFLLPLILVCYVRLPATTPENPSRSMRELLDPGMLYGLLSRPSLAFSAGLAVVLAFAFQAVTSFFPTFLIEYRGMSTQRASQIFSILFAIVVLLLPIMGRLSDRFGRDVILAFCLGTLAAGIGLSITASNSAFVILGAVLIGFGMPWGGVLSSRIMDNLAFDERSTGYGLIRTTYLLLASSGNVITGSLADAAGWPVSYGLLIVLLGIALVSIGVNRVFGLGL